MNTPINPPSRPKGTWFGIRSVNLALIALSMTLIGTTIADAQPKDTNRASGQYTCVGGRTLGGYGNTIYVLDSANREMVALRWNEGLSELEGVGYRDLAKDLRMEDER